MRDKLNQIVTKDNFTIVISNGVDPLLFIVLVVDVEGFLDYILHFSEVHEIIKSNFRWRIN